MPYESSFNSCSLCSFELLSLNSITPPFSRSLTSLPKDSFCSEPLVDVGDLGLVFLCSFSSAMVTGRVHPDVAALTQQRRVVRTQMTRSSWPPKTRYSRKGEQRQATLYPRESYGFPEIAAAGRRAISSRSGSGLAAICIETQRSTGGKPSRWVEGAEWEQPPS